MIEFEYYDPASLAMEFHAYSTGLCSDPYQAMRCGPMRLTGTVDNWWSAVLNFARYGSATPYVCPCSLAFIVSPPAPALLRLSQVSQVYENYLGRHKTLCYCQPLVWQSDIHGQ